MGDVLLQASATEEREREKLRVMGEVPVPEKFQRWSRSHQEKYLQRHNNKPLASFGTWEIWKKAKAIPCSHCQGKGYVMILIKTACPDCNGTV
jgi:RecJ-like exonuclease